MHGGSTLNPKSLEDTPSHRPSFSIDVEQLGCFLAEAFIRRVDGFLPDDRSVLLQACRKRLASEGGDIAELLLGVIQPGSGSTGQRL